MATELIDHATVPIVAGAFDISDAGRPAGSLRVWKLPADIEVYAGADFAIALDATSAAVVPGGALDGVTEVHTTAWYAVAGGDGGLGGDSPPPLAGYFPNGESYAATTLPALPAYGTILRAPFLVARVGERPAILADYPTGRPGGGAEGGGGVH